jgi:hypothetical protein
VSPWNMAPFANILLRHFAYMFIKEIDL